MRTLVGFMVFVALSLAVSETALADGWDFRLGLANLPEQNTLLGLEITRILNVSENLELGIGGVFRTDFSQTVGPGALSRLKYWLDRRFAVGAVAELGYLFHQSTANPASYTYLFAGPLLEVVFNPIFIQWEPGFLLYQGTNAFVPLRLSFGLAF